MVQNPFNIKVSISLYFPQSNTEDFGYQFFQTSTWDKVEIIDILIQFDYR